MNDGKFLFLGILGHLNKTDWTTFKIFRYIRTTFSSLQIPSCPNNSPKHKDSSCTVINDKEKHQILVFKTLEPAKWQKPLINYHNNWQFPVNDANVADRQKNLQKLGTTQISKLSETQLTTLTRVWTISLSTLLLCRWESKETLPVVKQKLVCYWSVRYKQSRPCWAADHGGQQERWGIWPVKSLP